MQCGTVWNALGRVSEFLLLTLFVMTCGCREASVSTSPQTSSSPTDVSVKNVPPSDAKSSSSEIPITIAPQISSIGAETGRKIETSEPATAANVAASKPAALPPIPKPTQDQIARWTTVDRESLQLLSCRDLYEIGLVKTAAAPGDGRHFILAGAKISLWSVDADKPEHIFFETVGENTIESMSISPDEKWIAAGDSEGTLRVWDLKDHNELHAKKLYPTGIIQAAISPDSRTIATMTYNNEVTIWNAADLRQLQRFTVDTNGIESVLYMTSELLAVAGESTSLWDVETGKLDKNLSPGRYNFSLGRTLDGSRFLFGHEDELVLWNIKDQKSDVVLKGGFAQNELAAFSSAGELLATSNQSTIRIWDTSTGMPVQFIDAFGWPVTGLAWLPETDLLLVSSMTGRTRIWGTLSNGEKHGMKPMHSSVTAHVPGDRVAASPPQLMQAIDLRTFPRLPEAKVIAIDEFTLMSEVTVGADEAMMFYRFQLDRAGWKEEVSDAASTGSQRFQKDAIALSLSCYTVGDSKTMVSLNVVGSYDLRWLPKLDHAAIEMVFENADTVIYRTKRNVMEVEVELLRKMQAAGWTSYSRLNSAHNEETNQRNLLFLRDGLTTGISIGSLPDDASAVNVQYSQSLTTKSIPVPQDSGYVEFDGSTEPLLVASSSMSLGQACEFYDKGLADDGWLARESGRTIEDDHATLPYIRGQQDLTIHLRQMESGRTQIIVGNDLQNSWQLAKPKVADSAASGIEAVDFPVLNESKTASYDPQEKSISISMDATPLVQVADQYVLALTSIGWKLDGSGLTSDEYVRQTFVKDNAEIELRARMTDGKATVNIQGDGLLWNKELPGGKKWISYETWLKTNHQPATLDLLDKFEKEMSAIEIKSPMPAEKE